MIKGLDVIKRTVKEDYLRLGGGFYNIESFIDALEKEYPDSSFYFDANLESVIDYLYDANFTDDYILELNNRVYGEFIDISYIKDYDIHLLEIGIR